MKSLPMNENYFNNPIKALHRLRAAGFTEKQAEAQVEIISDYVEHGIATKRDLKELELRLTIRTAAIVGSIVGFFSVLETLLK